MTDEEAIAVLDNILANYPYNSTDAEALELAITALEYRIERTSE